MTMVKNVFSYENEQAYGTLCEQLSSIFTQFYRLHNQLLEDGNETAAAVVENVITTANDDIGLNYGLGIIDVWDYMETVEIGARIDTEIVFRS